MYGLITNLYKTTSFCGPWERDLISSWVKCQQAAAEARAYSPRLGLPKVRGGWGDPSDR
jgi:hypothetical protein